MVVVQEKEIGVRVRGANLASTGWKDVKVGMSTISRINPPVGSGLCGCGR
jgi:hypothetical protein